MPNSCANFHRRIFLFAFVYGSWMRSNVVLHVRYFLIIMCFFFSLYWIDTHHHPYLQALIGNNFVLWQKWKFVQELGFDGQKCVMEECVQYCCFFLFVRDFFSVQNLDSQRSVILMWTFYKSQSISDKGRKCCWLQINIIRPFASIFVP